jgi:membrane-associated phospholipid phosphatase
VLLITIALWLGFLFEKSTLNCVIFTAINSQMPVWGGPYVWAFFTSLGDTAVAVILLWVILPKTKATLARLSLAVLFGGIASNAIKVFFHYPRPLVVMPDVIVVGPALHHNAFVSGHTLTAFLIAALLIQTYKKQNLILLLACFVGISRVMVGAHWPADVLTGAIVGWSLGSILNQLTINLQPKLEHVLAFLGWVLVGIALVFMLLGKMQNIHKVILFWQAFSVFGFAMLIPKFCRAMNKLFVNKKPVLPA